MLRRLKETLFQKSKDFVCGREEIYSIMSETPKGMFKDFVEEEFLKRTPNVGWILVCRDSLGRGFLLDSDVGKPAEAVMYIFILPNKAPNDTLYFTLLWELMIRGLEQSPTTLSKAALLANVVDAIRVELKARKEGVDALTEEEKETYYYTPALQLRVGLIVSIIPDVAHELFNIGASVYPPPWTVELWDWMPPQCFRKYIETRPITKEEVEAFFWEKRR